MGESTGYIFRFHWLCAHCKKSNITEFKKRFIPLSFYQDAKKALEEYNTMQSQLYEAIDDVLNILGEEEHHHGLIYLGGTFEEASRKLLNTYKEEIRKDDDRDIYECMEATLRKLFHDELECKGCLYELQEAKKNLVVALARVDGEVCTHCDGTGNEPEPSRPPEELIDSGLANDNTKYYEICHKCKGAGVNEGYLPPSWKQTREYTTKNKERKEDDTSNSNP